MRALDMVLEVYRDTFAVKTDRANEAHRQACVDLARLSCGTIEAAARELIEKVNKSGDFETYKRQGYAINMAISKLAATLEKAGNE